MAPSKMRQSAVLSSGQVLLGTPGESWQSGVVVGGTAFTQTSIVCRKLGHDPWLAPWGLRDLEQCPVRKTRVPTRPSVWLQGRTD